MGDFTAWIGTRWEARCAMRLPKGGVNVGDTFTYDAACAALALDPQFWLTVGNAVQLAAPPRLADTIDRKVRGADAADAKRAKGGFRFDANPLAGEVFEAGPAVAPDDAATETEAKA